MRARFIYIDKSNKDLFNAHFIPTFARLVWTSIRSSGIKASLSFEAVLRLLELFPGQPILFLYKIASKKILILLQR